MARKVKEIAAVQVPRLAPGFHAVGGVTGLYLSVADKGNRSWILRIKVGDRRRDMGLGGWPDVPLAEARTRAREARRKVEEGIDPIRERKAARAQLQSAKTFAECAGHVIAAKRPGWKSAKHADQWENTLSTYAFPIIGKMPVGEVEVADVVRVLSPIWTTRTETASRIRQRIEAVLDWAKVANLRTGENPARWRGNLEHLLAEPGKVTKKRSHPALPYAEIHAFIDALRAKDAMSAKALEFAILTAARTSEVLEATWAEIDLEEGIWIIPAVRMKAGREHRVPLSRPAIALLKSLPQIAGTKLVFPNYRGGAMSDAAMGKLIKDMHASNIEAGGNGWIDPRQSRVATTHGFRSTFKDWAIETTAYPGEMSEVALAHTVSDKTEAAYRRGDMFSKRIRMMADWAKFIDTASLKGENVVPIRKPA